MKMYKMHWHNINRSFPWIKDLILLKLLRSETFLISQIPLEILSSGSLRVHKEPVAVSRGSEASACEGETLRGRSQCEADTTEPSEQK